MIPNVALRNALLAAQGSCAEPGCTYAPEFCPRYWRRVFILCFGEEPKGEADKRWDELFKEGMPIHRSIREQQQRVKAAS